MGSLITNDAAGLAPLQMSNAATSAFHVALALAASSLARTPREQELALWLCCRDYVTFGSGAVGFDVRDLPWTVATFTEDRAFVLNAAAVAMGRRGWEHVKDHIAEDVTVAHLARFADLVGALRAEDLPSQAGQAWESPGFLRRCEAHGAFEHWEGCIVCRFLEGFRAA
jgi:hypothetical protein